MIADVDHAQLIRRRSDFHPHNVVGQNGEMGHDALIAGKTSFAIRAKDGQRDGVGCLILNSPKFELAAPFGRVKDVASLVRGQHVLDPAKGRACAFDPIANRCDDRAVVLHRSEVVVDVVGP